MTDVKGPGPVADAADDPGYSKDYWDIVFEQLGRRKLFKLGVAVLSLLYAVAIYAPLIANDKPYAITAIDYGAYDSAARSISAVVSSVARKVGQSDEEYAAILEGMDEETRAGAPADLAEDIAREGEAAFNRIDTMQAFLPDADDAILEAFRGKLEETIAAFAAGDRERAGTLADEAKTTARDIRRNWKSVRPADVESEAAPTGKLLEPQSFHPLRESLSPWEIPFMVLWLQILLWPIWNRVVNRILLGGDRGKIRRWRRRKLLGVLGIAIASGLAWAGTVESTGGSMSVSPWKGGLTDGTIVAVVEPSWPLLRYGYAETQPAENFRGPTWTATSEVDWLGYFVRGGRVFEPARFPNGTETEVRERTEAALAVLRDDGAGEAAWEEARGELTALRDDEGFSAVGDKQRSALLSDLFELRNGGEEAESAVERLSAALTDATGATPQPVEELAEEHGSLALVAWWLEWAYDQNSLPEKLRPGAPVGVRVGEPARNDGGRHWTGTDELGRDFMVRMIWGGRVSLAVGIISAVLLTVIGVVIGSIAGYFGGWVDVAIMRLIEILQAIPAFFLMLIVLAFTDPNVVPPIIAIVVVIALIRWTGAARLVRGEFLRLREQEFVVAAQALGFSNRRTIFKHVLPNALSPVLVNAAFAVAAGILTESAISFLGFGVRHPEASWGSLVNESRSPEHWWIQVFPGVLIFVTVTCYNLVGDAIRDALDPKMKAV